MHNRPDNARRMYNADQRQQPCHSERSEESLCRLSAHGLSGRRRDATIGETQMSRYVVCINNTGYGISLEVRKVYRVIPDEMGDAAGMIRVIDETGEDYLFEMDRFVPVELSADAAAALGQVVA